ncbi:hypothetical protein [uncultured Roseobacter sp.]|uniref:hypothetical protein n=1 Tax=uncultured Roseobacter sp. TaxID=114847 RepID=UPI00261E5CD4|nr:hypothetical protein [uncultured Roseobacter sp.]
MTPEMRAVAERILTDEVPAKVAAMGESNDLGFVIIHPGDGGVSILVQWWVQGSVLCQHFHRQLYGAAAPLETATRPAIGCVWELAIIDAEREAWCRTMMQADPEPERYLAMRLVEGAV